VRENIGEVERRGEFGEEKEMVPEKDIFGGEKKTTRKRDEKSCFRMRSRIF
jgi:hypothetical protein